MNNRNQDIKNDNGKLRLELIPTSADITLGRILSFGAEKYGANTWQEVETDRYVGALKRHLIAYLEDPQSRDKESGFLHIEHVLCNAAFLNDFEARKCKYGIENESIN